MSTEDYRTPGVRAAERIAAAHAARPRVDHDGRPLDGPTTYQYNVHGHLVAATPAPEPQPTTDTDTDTVVADAVAPPAPRPAPDAAQGARGTDSPTSSQPVTHNDVRLAAAHAATGRGPSRTFEYDSTGKPVAIH